MVKTIHELQLEQQCVILRVDYNVPINPEGKVIDDTRIKSSLPTLKYLLEKNCKIIILSHLGRPKGYDPSLSLKKILPILEKLTAQHIYFEDSIESAQENMSQRPFPSITLLENLRFNEAEENPEHDPNFAHRLSKLGDFYIDDAFACAHRDHSSITRINQFFPERKGSGILLTHEITELKKVLRPASPFFLLLGGSKISTKIGIIDSLLPKADAIFIGGAMAFPFMKAKGLSIGSSKVDEQQVIEAHKIIESTSNKMNIIVAYNTRFALFGQT
jgi:phosphoglycerate kinase